MLKKKILLALNKQMLSKKLIKAQGLLIEHKVEKEGSTQYYMGQKWVNMYTGRFQQAKIATSSSTRGRKEQDGLILQEILLRYQNGMVS